jgi:mercuric ion transport protein
VSVVRGAAGQGALPIALVTVGAGSTVAALVSTAPWLVGLSRHKGWIFLGAGVLLLGNYWALYRGGAACEPGGACDPRRPLGRRLRRVFWGGSVLYGIPVVAAYLSLPIARALGY